MRYLQFWNAQKDRIEPSAPKRVRWIVRKGPLGSCSGDHYRTDVLEGPKASIE